MSSASNPGRKKWLLLALASAVLLLLLPLALSALANRSLPTGSTVVDHLSGLDKARASELYHLRRSLGDDAWPGFASADIPVVLYNEQYAFLIGGSSPPPNGWWNAPDGHLVEGTWQLLTNDAIGDQGYFRLEIISPGENPPAFAVWLGDRWAASMGTLEWMKIDLVQVIRGDLPSLVAQVFPYHLFINQLVSSSDHYIALMAHESFHAYQGTVAPERLAAAEAATSAEEQYPWQDEALQEAWQRELELLTEALKQEGEAEKRALVQQFLENRNRRRLDAGLSDQSVAYEQQREWLEGLAKYVELEIWRQAATTHSYNPLPALVADPDFDHYESFERHWSREVNQIGRMASDEGDGRFYYSGMAQAVLLDGLLPGWKSQVMADGVFLEELLQLAVGE